MVNRREFLKTSSLIGIMAGFSSCIHTAGLLIPESAYLSARHLPPIRLSTGRIIKETVGLRPFRVSGPRIEPQTLGTKTIIHNYGHGGSGWSLSWGTGNLVAEMALATGETRFAVLGSGVIGLTTARLLQNRGYEVTIFTKDLPPNVTSSKATGTWSPTFKLIDKSRITTEFVQKFQKAVSFSFNAHQNLLGMGDIVQWVDNYHVSNGDHPSGHEQIPELEVYNRFLPPRVSLTKKEHCFDTKEVTRGSQLIFNIPSYLKFQMDAFYLAGGKIIIQEMNSVEDIDKLPFTCIVNCTGLGSKTLFNDDEMTPIRGQLSFLIPQPEIKYSLSTDYGYFIPRKDGLVMGSSDNTRVGSWDLQPDAEQTENAVLAMQKIIAGMKT